MMRKIILLFAITLMLSGCAAIHTGYMANSAALSSGNFMYVKRNIKGVSKAEYILGIGGFSKETLVDDARQDMLINNYLIKDNQALVNLTVNFKTSYIFFGIYTSVTCVVTADVVEFKDCSAK
jgi:hypothetical protein